MLYYPSKVNKDRSLTKETCEGQQYEPVVPSQTFDHITSYEEAQTREEDCDGQKRDGYGD
jgi:hypothetical protein